MVTNYAFYAFSCTYRFAIAVKMQVLAPFLPMALLQPFIKHASNAATDARRLA
jgi:hypothetical protein